ncbi:hypothetical protein KI387_030133, partial [Taxus chinensis]
MDWRCVTYKETYVDLDKEVSRVVISDEIGGKDVKVDIVSDDVGITKEICDKDVDAVMGAFEEIGATKVDEDVVRVGLDVVIREVVEIRVVGKVNVDVIDVEMMLEGAKDAILRMEVDEEMDKIDVER